MLEYFEEKLDGNKRPVIAISYDYNNWILERFAQHIKLLNHDKYDFLLFSVHHLRKCPQYYRKLFTHVDLILNMLPSLLLDIRALTDKPIINTVHHWVDDIAIRPYIINSQYIITVSNEWKEKIIDKFKYPPNQISMIHCGVEKRFLNKCQPLYPSCDDAITVGFFAKNTSNEQDRKGTQHLKNFIYFLNENKKLDNFRFVISGAGWDSFINDIRRLGANVIYTKFVDDKQMPSLYHSLDFYLMLSNIEGGPATILESMASQVVAVSTNIGLVKDIGKDKNNIILVDNNNYKQIYDKIIECQANKNLRNTIIENAYKLAQNMTYEKVFSDYSVIFQKFLKKYKPGLVTALNITKTQKFLRKNAPVVEKRK